MKQSVWKLRGTQDEVYLLREAVIHGQEGTFSVWIHYYTDDHEAIPVQDQVQLVHFDIKDQSERLAEDGHTYVISGVVGNGPEALVGHDCRVVLHYPTYDGTFELV